MVEVYFHVCFKDFERDAETGSMHESVIVETRSPTSIIAEEIPTLKMVCNSLLFNFCLNIHLPEGRKVCIPLLGILTQVQG